MSAFRNVLVGLVVTLCGHTATAIDRTNATAFVGTGLGLKVGHSKGAHSIGIEVDKYSFPLVSDGLDGSSYGFLAEYLFRLGKFRLGPQWVSEKTYFRASDYLGNRYVSLSTDLRLHELHSLRILGGYVTNYNLMPYAFVGVALSRGSLAGKIEVLHWSTEGDRSGWVAGPTYGFGTRYRFSRNQEIGLELGLSHFNKRFRKCEDRLPLCVYLPVRIEPKTLSLTYTRRFW